MINKTYLELKEKNGKELIGVVITASRWNSKESFFEINLNNWFMPFLEQLVKKYTKLQLNSILKLKSKYALTLYKYICSWNDENKNINQRYITTKDLKKMLGLFIDDYVYNGKFQRKLFENYTIKKAILEINEKTNLILSFRKNKKGNKIQNYEFTWMQKEKALTTKTLKKQVSLFDVERENQKQQNTISQEQVK